MTETKRKRTGEKSASLPAEESLLAAEGASGIGAFELDLDSNQWAWRPQVATLFGLDPENAPTDFDAWLTAAFPDDAPKIRSAMENARHTGSFYVEFRIK